MDQWNQHNTRFAYIGNAGGYLGLFLGYALLNVPELALGAYKWVMEKCKGT